MRRLQSIIWTERVTITKNSKCSAKSSLFAKRMFLSISAEWKVWRAWLRKSSLRMPSRPKSPNSNSTLPRTRRIYIGKVVLWRVAWRTSDSLVSLICKASWFSRTIWLALRKPSFCWYESISLWMIQLLAVVRSACIFTASLKSMSWGSAFLFQNSRKSI